MKCFKLKFYKVFRNSFHQLNFYSSLSPEEMQTINSFNRNERIVIPMVNGKIRDLGHIHYPFSIEY